MYRSGLKKPDGRDLILYSRNPIPEGIEAPSPQPAGAPLPNPHLRWHPLRGEWVAYASHRQNRVFLPPKEFNPLAVTRSQDAPTEVPDGDYDVAVFENLSPSLTRVAGEPPASVVPTAPGYGACEVVVFTKDPETSLGKLPLWHIELLMDVWADRTKEIGSREGIKYVMPFENRGVEVGVTLHHPHGQIYAYPFVPPVAAREQEEQEAYYAANGRSLLGDLIRNEIDDRKRVLYQGRDVIAFVPAFARYPYEVWIAPRRAVPRLTELDESERRDFARALKTTLLKYDGLWKRPFPYLMAFHQAPTDGKPHSEWHLHLEFSPPYRSENRLKYLAGTELAAGMFANDSIPEEKAAELQAVEVSLD